MTPEERKIEQAAEEFCEFRRTNSQGYPPKQWFIAGAKSEATKEYWQQGMYTEKEVKQLCVNAMTEAIHWVNIYSKNQDTPDLDPEKWFNKNKKK